MTESISIQMSQILDEYEQHVQDVTNDAIKRVAREAVRTLRNTSPKGRTGSYARGWSVKNMDRHGNIVNLVVHNRTNYQLTHLLENGHVIRNKKSTYGRTSGRKHIAPVEQHAVDELPAEIERNL